VQTLSVTFRTQWFRNDVPHDIKDRMWPAASQGNDFDTSSNALEDNAVPRRVVFTAVMSLVQKKLHDRIPKLLRPALERKGRCSEDVGSCKTARGPGRCPNKYAKDFP
jgi:hypothetical protein